MSYYENPSVFSGKKFGSGSPDPGVPRLKPDIIVRQHTHKQEVYYIVKDPENLTYYKFSDSEWRLISLFDGNHSEQEIIEEYNSKNPDEIIDEETIASYKESLRDMEILDISVAQKNLILMEKIRSQRKLRAEGKSRWDDLFEIKFSAWDPDKDLNRIVPYFRFFWTKQFFVFSLVMIALMLSINFVKWEEFKEGTIKLYSFTDKSFWELIVFVFLMTTTGTLHELGHAMTLKHYGGEVHQMGFLLFYLTPAFYVDMTDSYMLPRRQSLWVTMAGTYTELLLCSVASLVWYFAVPGTLIYDLSFQVVLFTGVSSFLVNMNPLIKLDGYFALMDILEIPDLREASFSYIGGWFKRTLFRVQADRPDDLTRRKKRIFLTYGAFAILYTALVYLFVVFWLRNIYLETFRGYGYALLILTVFFLFRSTLKSGLGFLRFVYLDKKEMLMKRRGMAWGITGVLLFLLLFVFPRTHMKISSPFVIQPEKRMEVRAEVDGFIQQVLTKENGVVKLGEVLARMTNPDLEKNITKVVSDLSLVDRELAQLQYSMDASEYSMKNRAREQLSHEKTELEVKMMKLTLLAPMNGKVMTPYMKEKTGTYLNKGSTFCEVADVGKVRVEIPITEYYIHDVNPGQEVELKLDAYPMETFHGEVQQISSAMTNRVEAVEGTFTEFRVTALIDNSDERLIPGMKGDAKILGKKYSIGGRISREVWRWIKSRIW